MKKAIFFFLVFSLALGATSFALAQEGTSANTNVRPAIDVACIQAAVDKRETAIIAAFDKRNTAVKSALETRKTALKESWAKPTWKEKVTANVAAWKAFRSANYAARKAYNAGVRSAWKQFYTDRKACKGAKDTGETSETDLYL